ncbi:MAG: hypothetical protein IPP74_08585 [Alphaproteobacteria bacterium]|nr:hypothetical protein [Alphaproteobacteria bacterium]
MVLYVAFVITTYFDSRNGLSHELKLLAQLVGNRNAVLMSFQDYDEIRKNLKIFDVKKDVIASCIYSKNQELVVSLIKDGNPFSCSPYATKNWNYLTVNEDIELNNVILGKIIIYAKTNYIIKDLIIRLTYASGIFIIISIIVILFSYKIQTFISIPIDNLINITSSIKTGNYNIRAKKLYEDEIGILTESFNSMLTTIHERDLNLKEMNQSLEQKVQERTEDLEYALKVKEDFLSNMSHEIRTPIHGVISFVRLLVEEWNTSDDDILFNYAQRAHKSSDRLLALINNLLDMSKFEKGAVQLERKELLFSDLIQTVIAETSGVVEAKHEKLVFQPMANEPLVEVDEGRMAQVMTNLIGNAVKYSEKGTIRISQSVNPEAIFLDGGGSSTRYDHFNIRRRIGIPEDELVKIFDKFFESSLTKTKAGGTGLGLAISREIVKAHLGTIWAENNKNGVGSTFTFVFPLKEIPGITQATEKYV